MAKTFPIPLTATYVAFSPDGQYLLAQESEGA
jgi:hypothetical protein